MVAVVAALAVAACGGSSTPKAFPGSALDKATEYVRQAKRVGVQHGDAKHTAEIYETDGDGFCTAKSAAERREEAARTAKAQPDLDPRIADLAVTIYCPWLL